MMEEQVLKIVNKDPKLINVKKYTNNNDLLQEYSYNISNMLISRKVFKKFMQNKLYDVNYKNKEGNTLLHILVSLNYIDLVSDLLDWSLEFNKPILFLENNKNQTIIHYSCYFENSLLLKKLIGYLYKTKQNITILNQPDNHNRTPISICIKNKNEKMLQTLLEYGVNPNYFIDEKYIPLHYSIQKRFKKGILLLIRYGAQKYTPSYIKKTLIEKTKSKFAINLIKQEN